MLNLKIETIKNLNGDEVSFCSSRGGMITSLKIKGKEIFYFDKETFSNRKESVRGGVPVLFPNAGELIKNELFPKLKRHGFARNMEWGIEESSEKFKEILLSSKETKDIYPYDFKLFLSGEFEEDGSFTFTQEVENISEEKSMPISMGLHPYFFVLDNEKKNIKFDFEGGSKVEEGREVWMNGGTLYIDNPKLKDINSILKIELPKQGTLIIDVSIVYEKIWIWSLPGKDFICIEPIMRDLNGIIDNPELIKPKEKFLAQINLKLE